MVIVGGARTAIGRFGGGLKDVEAAELGAACIREALARSDIDAGEVEEVVMGQVGQVGADAYNARRCRDHAGHPASSTAMNVNRLCSSGLQAIVTGAQEILTGQADVVVAGGDESMSRQPFLDYGARDGWRLGDRRARRRDALARHRPVRRLSDGRHRGAGRGALRRLARGAGRVRGAQPGARRGGDRGRGTSTSEIVPMTAPRADEPFARDEHPRAGTTRRAARRS